MLFLAQVEWIITRRGSSKRTMSWDHKLVALLSSIACFVFFIHFEFWLWIINIFILVQDIYQCKPASTVQYIGPLVWKIVTQMERKCYEIQCWCFFLFSPFTYPMPYGAKIMFFFLFCFLIGSIKLLTVYFLVRNEKTRLLFCTTGILLRKLMVGYFC